MNSADSLNGVIRAVVQKYGADDSSGSFATAIEEAVQQHLRQHTAVRL